MNDRLEKLIKTYIGLGFAAAAMSLVIYIYIHRLSYKLYLVDVGAN